MGRHTRSPPEHALTSTSTGHLQVGAGGAAGQEGIQPEGPELMEKEADLQVALPRVSVTGWGKMGWGACQARRGLHVSHLVHDLGNALSSRTWIQTWATAVRPWVSLALWGISSFIKWR